MFPKFYCRNCGGFRNRLQVRRIGYTQWRGNASIGYYHHVCKYCGEPVVSVRTVLEEALKILLKKDDSIE